MRKYIKTVYGRANHDIILFLYVFIRISFKFLFICVVRYVMSKYSFCLIRNIDRTLSLCASALGCVNIFFII